ncbi:MAG: 16S rRNA (guanine(527)-N(7))-methyltransferase RsmG [Nitrospirae bacterium]|nr:16S rRNA (guanine(527)-N(7))-methyltransferase RsmG [Nitrospirota bacterium]MBF0536593.1 16S rRNA (guanine(527)-N(7))-methyltransferase RsmG [Nitrospirota bacterium]MBF0618158.1 16S rRNA (guanine(527)-N(7))-methyltransferase RsmG [Nitrospirota bacterium]
MKKEKEQKTNAEAALTEGLRALSIEPSASIVESFMTFLQELKKWSKTHNLTAITEDTEIVTKHFLDSLLFLKGIPDEAKTLLDVGSGAGFPGIPIKIVRPELVVTLMEPRKKRVVFLRHMIHILKLPDTDVYEGRLEDVGIAENTPRYDCVVVRAALSFADFTRLASPLIGTHGCLVLGKGKGYESEIQKNTDDYKIDIIHSNIPLTETERFILVVKPAGLSSS